MKKIDITKAAAVEYEKTNGPINSMHDIEDIAEFMLDYFEDVVVLNLGLDDE